jgi:hypothetical protein
MLVGKRSKPLIERLGTLMERSCKRSGRMDGQKRLGSFEPGRSNALERMAENVHGTGTFTLQK